MRQTVQRFRIIDTRSVARALAESIRKGEITFTEMMIGLCGCKVREEPT